MISKRFTSIKLLSAAFCLSTTLNADPEDFAKTICDANTALNEKRIEESIQLFLKGHEELKASIRECWIQGLGKTNWDTLIEKFNGPQTIVDIPEEHYKQFYRGNMTPSCILLGSWLSNELVSTNSWVADRGVKLDRIFDDTVTPNDLNIQPEHSASTRDLLIQKFKCINTNTLFGIGDWINEYFCAPVSYILENQFELVPSKQQHLLQILNLYRCYIECDAGGKYQTKFSQFKYAEIHKKLHEWFASILTCTPINGSVPNDEVIDTCYYLFKNYEREDNPALVLPDPTQSIMYLNYYQIEINPIIANNKSILYNSEIWPLMEEKAQFEKKFDLSSDEYNQLFILRKHANIQQIIAKRGQKAEEMGKEYSDILAKQEEKHALMRSFGLSPSRKHEARLTALTEQKKEQTHKRIVQSRIRLSGLSEQEQTEQK